MLFSVSLNGPLQHPPTVYECLGCEGQDHPVWVCWLDYPSLLVLTQTGWFRCVFVLKEIISAGRRLAALEQWEESLGSAVDEGMSSVQRNKRPWTEHLRVWIQHLLAVPCRSAKWILMDLKLELLVLHHPFLWPRHTGQPCLFPPLLCRKTRTARSPNPKSSFTSQCDRIISTSASSLPEETSILRPTEADRTVTEASNALLRFVSPHLTSQHCKLLLMGMDFR